MHELDKREMLVWRPVRQNAAAPVAHHYDLGSTPPASTREEMVCAYQVGQAEFSPGISVSPHSNATEPPPPHLFQGEISCHNFYFNPCKTNTL